MTCPNCRKPYGVLRNDATPLPDDDKYCWRTYNSHAPCEDPLIETAPELLAIMERFVARLDEWPTTFEPELKAARAVIAKAKGES